MADSPPGHSQAKWQHVGKHRRQRKLTLEGSSERAQATSEQQQQQQQQQQHEFPNPQRADQGSEAPRAPEGSRRKKKKNRGVEPLSQGAEPSDKYQDRPPQQHNSQKEHARSPKEVQQTTEQQQEGKPGKHQKLQEDAISRREQDQPPAPHSGTVSRASKVAAPKEKRRRYAFILGTTIGAFGMLALLQATQVGCLHVCMTACTLVHIDGWVRASIHMRL